MYVCVIEWGGRISCLVPRLANTQTWLHTLPTPTSHHPSDWRFSSSSSDFSLIFLQHLPSQDKRKVGDSAKMGESGNTYLLSPQLEDLHLLLLSSGPVDCSDQKGIDDPFSELIDIERPLFRFHISPQWWWYQAKPELESIYIGFALRLRTDGKTIWWNMRQVIYSSKSWFVALSKSGIINGKYHT